MGLYSKYVFPRLMNLVMSNREMERARVKTLSDVSGEIFEIGFGTGLNLPHYPPAVKKIVTADINPGMAPILERRIAESPIEVEHHVISGESLPFEDASFDSVVCTWTLCSIANVEQALGEASRILKPGGRFFFVEHGLAEDPKVQKWQNRMNPIQKALGDGCNLNRNMRELIEGTGFRMDRIENFYMRGAPRPWAYMYQGIAVKAP